MQIAKEKVLEALSYVQEPDLKKGFGDTEHDKRY